MDNYAIADQLSLLAKLMDIHGENSFKSKTYATAAFAIEKMPEELVIMPHEKIYKLKGIGDAVGSKVIELIDSGELKSVQDYISNTPEGVMEMMNIKGIGPKKINTIWKELHIDSIEDLKTACEENRIAEKKGFGEKTQQKILETIQFQKSNFGKYLYAQVENFAALFEKKIQAKFPDEQFHITGAYRRQLEIIEKLEWITTASKNKMKNFLSDQGLLTISENDDNITFNAEDSLIIQFHFATKDNFIDQLFHTSCSREFLSAWQQFYKPVADKNFKNEKEIFKTEGIQFIPPFRREKKSVIELAKQKKIKEVIQTNEIKGLIHAHSNWSDGAYTIEEMAKELIELNFEYLVISDHSKAAYYAGGLSEQKITEQHKYIDGLNKKFAPFKIYKSIECDILSDGSLDYADKILSSFDLVIASIHSNIQMNEQKAMQRLLGAINNPFITILGHMTGRRLLKRNGYPVDHKTIIDACANNLVVIEINANPQRLDMSWEWIEYALEKNLFLSINPDAHSIDEFQNIKYGVLVAQKGGLTKENNLSSLGRDEFDTFLQQRKKLKGIV